MHRKLQSLKRVKRGGSAKAIQAEGFGTALYLITLSDYSVLVFHPSTRDESGTCFRLTGSVLEVSGVQVAHAQLKV